MKTINTAPKIQKAVKNFLETKKKKTKKTVKLVLEELGNTSREVAKALKAEGIKGSVDASKCPVALYLKKELGGRWVVTATNIYKAREATHFFNVIQGRHYPVPPVVSKFIRSFDDGHYPDLRS